MILKFEDVVGIYQDELLLHVDCAPENWEDEIDIEQILTREDLESREGKLFFCDECHKVIR